MATATAELAATERAASRARAVTQGESIESDVPTIETAAYARSVPRWQLVRDVYDGTEAIRAGGTTYLPAFKGETDALYEARKTISSVFNPFARTIDATTGVVCDPEPVLSDGMPKVLVDMWENVDGAGMHGAVFLRHLVTAAMIDGYAGILTEYPRPKDIDLARPGVSAAAAIAVETGSEFDASDIKALGLRPYFILVKADEVRTVYSTVNGKRTLTMLIRKTNTSEKKGRFGIKTTTRYDVYELIEDGTVTHERWTVDTAGGTPTLELPAARMRNLTGIPWSPLALGKKKAENEYRPTLLDLAYLTLTHHRIATGILSLEENAFVPTKWRVGAPKDPKTGKYPELVLGHANVIEIPLPPAGVTMPNPPVGHLSPPVDVLDPAMKSLENCKAEAGAMGAAFLTPQPVQETATAARMDATAEKSNISLVSRDSKDCVESAFSWAGQYVKETAGSVALNTDFVGQGIDAAFVERVAKAYVDGAVTIEEYRYALVTGKLPEDFKADDTKDLLAEQAAKEAERVNAAADATAIADARAQS